MIKIENPALYDGRAYGNIIKEDFAAARRVLSPATMLDWIELALQRNGFEWKHPDHISKQGIKEMERAGYMKPYGADDWLFCTERPGGNDNNYSPAPADDYSSYTTPSKAPPPDPARVFRKQPEEPGRTERRLEYEAVYSELEVTDDGLPF